MNDSASLPGSVQTVDKTRKRVYDAKYEEQQNKLSSHHKNKTDVIIGSQKKRRIIRSLVHNATPVKLDYSTIDMEKLFCMAEEAIDVAEEKNTVSHALSFIKKEKSKRNALPQKGQETKVYQEYVRGYNYLNYKTFFMVEIKPYSYNTEVELQELFLLALKESYKMCATIIPNSVDLNAVDNQSIFDFQNTIFYRADPHHECFSRKPLDFFSKKFRCHVMCFEKDQKYLATTINIPMMATGNVFVCVNTGLWHICDHLCIGHISTTEGKVCGFSGCVKSCTLSRDHKIMYIKKQINNKRVIHSTNNPDEFCDENKGGLDSYWSEKNGNEQDDELCENPELSDVIFETKDEEDPQINDEDDGFEEVEEEDEEDDVHNVDNEDQENEYACSVQEEYIKEEENEDFHHYSDADMDNEEPDYSDEPLLPENLLKPQEITQHPDIIDDEAISSLEMSTPPSTPAENPSEKRIIHKVTETKKFLETMKHLKEYHQHETSGKMWKVHKILKNSHSTNLVDLNPKKEILYNIIPVSIQETGGIRLPKMDKAVIEDLDFIKRNDPTKRFMYINKLVKTKRKSKPMTVVEFNTNTECIDQLSTICTGLLTSLLLTNINNLKKTQNSDRKLLAMHALEKYNNWCNHYKIPPIMLYARDLYMDVYAQFDRSDRIASNTKDILMHYRQEIMRIWQGMSPIIYKDTKMNRTQWNSQGKEFILGIVYVRAEQFWLTFETSPLVIWEADKLLGDLLIKQQDIRSRTSLTTSSINKGRTKLVSFVSSNKEHALKLKSLNFLTY